MARATDSTAVYEVRAIGAHEVDPFLMATLEAFHEEPQAESLALVRTVIEPERTLAAFAGADGAIVATSLLLTMHLAVPGGVVPMAGLSAVGVDSVHRRRGLLDRMMRGHLSAIHARGVESISALWASEAGIYGRWGYGPATRLADLTVRSGEARLMRDAPPLERRVGSPPELTRDLSSVYDAVLPASPGLLARDAKAWKLRVSDPEHEREGAGRLRALVVREASTPVGYALFAVRKRDVDGRAQDGVEVRELMAATASGATSVWDYLLGLSLTHSVHWPVAPEDEPLVHMLSDARAVSAQLHDALYVRLVDVPRALAERTYAAPIDLVFEVEDSVCPWNEGRWRLQGDDGGATCTHTDAEADLGVTATELGAAYLGGTSLPALAAAGRVRETTPGALEQAGQAFKGARAPWCPESF